MSTELQLAPKAQAVAKPSLAVHDFESVLRFALEKGASLTEITAVRRELKAEQAKEQFDTALADFQAACPVILKQKGVPDGTGKLAYSYAPLEDIIHQIKPLLRAHGFSFTLDTDTASQDGWVIAKCHLTHCGGHTATSTAKFPLGTGTRLMSTTQVYAAALTFASRRVLCNSLGLVTAGEDMDGRTSTPKPAGPSTLAAEPGLKELATELWRALPAEYAGKNVNWAAAKQYLVDEGFITPEEHGGDVGSLKLTPARMREIINAVKAKKKP